MTAQRPKPESLLRWMWRAPVDRFGRGLVLPLLAFGALLAALLYVPPSRPDTVLYNPRTGTLVSERIVDPDTGAEITERRTRITYWEKWSGFEGEAIRDAVDRFNQQQHTIYVELVVQGDISAKVRIATAGGNPPDLAGLYSFDVPVFAMQNALIPLDDFIARMPEPERIGPDTYLESYGRLGVYDGRTWALPTAPSTIALHWNKQLFREAGLDPDRPPRTLAELDAFADKLTRRDADGRLVQIGFLPTEPGWWKYAWGFWFGGELWDGEGRLTADSPEHLAALRWVRSYVDRYGADELARFKNSFGPFSSPRNAFFSGKVAMELQGVWLANFIARYAPPDFEWGAAPFPSAVPGLEGVCIAEADMIGIPRGARHPELAFAFITFMASPEGLEILCRGQGKHSPLARTSPGWTDTHPNPEVALFTDLARGPQCHRTPPIGIWLEYKRAWDRAFDDVWGGRASPEEALGALQERMQRRFDDERTLTQAPAVSAGDHE